MGDVVKVMDLADVRLTRIRLELDGLPPSKRGDVSALGATSNQRPKVVALLKVARKEMKRSGSEGFGDLKLRLDVDVYAGRNDEPWDATNYLGGIADVLEGKAKRLKAQPGSLDHLEDLKDLGLYDDDRQIKEIHYREFASERARYVVTITVLEE